MTVFFNKKEEVLDIELTPYGEALLSVGQFKPTYYAFFDEDVLYDASGSAGIIEAQNDAESRIQADTPKLKTQAVFSGIESNLVPLVDGMRSTYDTRVDPETGAVSSVLGSFRLTPERVYDPMPPNIDANFSLIEPLGRMQLGSENAPSWDVRLLKGQLSGAVNYLTGSRTSRLEADVRRIPQLEFNINYKVLVGDDVSIEYNGEIAEQGRIMSRLFNDGTYLYLSEEPGALVFVVDEENSTNALEYDLEVFEVLDDYPASETPTLRPLNFTVDNVEVRDQILLDQPLRPRTRELDPSFAEYYFLVNCDREIPSEEICPVLEGVRPRGITLNEIPYDCPDVRRIGRFDIYGTNVADEEPCDD